MDLGKRDGRPAVIETGSITCSIYTSKIDWMQEFAKAYPEVDFFVVYTRETHPGGRVAPHASFDDKLACARAAKSEMGERRTILVDGIDGALHQQLGSFPNMLFVIDGDSRIVYRARWNDPEQLDEVLTALVRADALPHTESTGFWFSRQGHLAQVLAGWSRGSARLRALGAAPRDGELQEAVQDACQATASDEEVVSSVRLHFAKGSNEHRANIAAQQFHPIFKEM